MSSYLTTLLTTTTSRYATLRRTLLSDEADGDTEDDSHISRVLRAYYTEKGRPLPPWLPPDPKAPQPASTPVAMSSGRYQQGQHQHQHQQQVGGMTSRGSGSGLSDLWDASPQQQSQGEPLSLRRAAAAAGGRGPGRTAGSSGAPVQPPQGSTPLPSQRVGSYQSQSQFAQLAALRAAEPSPPPSSGGGSTAQERLKARLWGSGGSSRASSTGSAGGGAGAGGSMVGQRNPYEEQKPFAAANTPWAGGGNEYGGGAGGGGGGGAYGSLGYTGPRPAGRERVGLPSGPRPQR